MLYATGDLLASHLVCVCNEEHAVISGGHLKRMRLVEYVLCSLDGQAAVHLHMASDKTCMDDWLHAVALHSDSYVLITLGRKKGLCSFVPRSERSESICSAPQ